MGYFNYLNSNKKKACLVCWFYLVSVILCKFIAFCNILWMYPFDTQVIIQDFRSWELNAFSGFEPLRTYMEIFFCARFIVIKGSRFCYSTDKGNWTFLSQHREHVEFVISLQPRLLNNLLMHSCPDGPVQESSMFSPSLHCNSPLTQCLPHTSHPQSYFSNCSCALGLS